MDERKEVLKQIFELINNYFDQSNNHVTEYLPPDQLKKSFDFSITKDGLPYTKLVEFIKRYLEYCVRTSNKQFFNQLYAGMNFPAFIGEIITSLTNTSMYTYEVAPVATLMEMELLDKMNAIIGFNDGNGTFLTGGSNANLIAMFSARNQAIPDIKTKGMVNNGAQLSIFTSDQCHYSVDTAANILGIGTDYVYKINTDEHGRMRPENLERAIQQSLDHNAKPFFIGATAGTTLLGAFDPINEIADIAERHRIWLHVDGSFGGTAVLSKKYRSLLNGIERADSFSWDAHKLMNIPLMCSVLLVKKKETLIGNLTNLDTEYIYHENDTQSYDLGKKSIQCGRRVDALKLWLAWQFFGDTGYEARTDKLFELAQYAERKVTADERLELLALPQSFAVCFRYKNKNSMPTNDFNLKLREELKKTGKSLINYGYIKNEVAIRFVAVDPDVNQRDIDQLFDNLLSVAAQLDR